jgi:hypothetical protein
MTGPGQGEEQQYTEDELRFLATLRQTSGRTCRSCRWLSMRGQQRGCFPEGKYRKFLSGREYESGCDMFSPREEGGTGTKD